MSNFPSYREYTYTIPASGAVDLNSQGSAFGCLDASGLFYVLFDGQPRTQFQKGLSFELPKEKDEYTGDLVQQKFNQIRIENRGETEIEVTVFVGDGHLRDARLTIPADLVAYTGAARSMRSSTEEIASGVRKSIVASDPDRTEVMITNMGVSAVFIGEDEVAYKRGLPLAAGSTATLKIQAEIFAYAQASGIQTLAILETLK